MRLIDADVLEGAKFHSIEDWTPVERASWQWGWNDVEVPTSRIIEVFGKDPLFGHKSGKRMNTNWLVFFKEIRT